jgi:hypothetical protein
MRKRGSDPNAKKQLNPQEKLELLERFRLPIYLGKATKSAYLNKAVLDRFQVAAVKHEIMSVYESCFKHATGIDGRKKVVKSFVFNFPDLAWRQSEWFWNLYIKVRSEGSYESSELRKAIAQGMAKPDRMSSKFHKQQRIEEARTLLKELKRPRRERGVDLKSILENIHRPFAVTRADMEKSERPKLERCLIDLECPISLAAVIKRLHRKGIASTILMVVAKKYDIRERDLETRSPLENS